jgi:hypothetical protein
MKAKTRASGFSKAGRLISDKHMHFFASLILAAIPRASRMGEHSHLKFTYELDKKYDSSSQETLLVY